MSRQHSSPYLVTNGSTFRLDREKQSINEGELQDFIFRHPLVLPVDEIEPVFQDLFPVCREMPTNAGPIDVVFINQLGMLTVVECKLWKNPQARREVVGQILDYAKELSVWTYEQLESAVQRARQDPDFQLYDLVSDLDDSIEEDDFIDNVSKNLRRGRFLLLIVGDGIREEVEQISNFLQQHAHLNFSFSLVETAIFQLPPELGVEGYLIQPRVVVQTVEIERAVVRIESDKIVIEPANTGSTETRRGRRTTISEQAFFETVALSPESVVKLRLLVEQARDQGLTVEPGQNSLMLKLDMGDHLYNFGVFRTDGTFANFGMGAGSEATGAPSIGNIYLNELASLVNGEVDTSSPSAFHWSVRKNGGYVSIEDILAVDNDFLDLIERTIRQIQNALDE